ncbi:hypothetical protein FACS189490_03160 [Clostridia bacterium]|nr:hypothetical protein FACS189490_03160 [Clostridia bacterium]
MTGFVFHNKVKNILYARTDIGGVYRFDFSNRVWKSLMDHVTTIERWESYPLSIALDDNDHNILYAVAGDNHEKNFLCRSSNRGETFEYFHIPAEIHGNAPGRGTGERLLVDPLNSDVLYFGSQTRGLFVSRDRGENWEKIPVKPKNGNEEQNIAFVWRDRRGKTLIVSTAGDGNAIDSNTRGKSLYISRDGGAAFEILPGQPEAPQEGNFRGFVGQRAAFSGEYLYITMGYSLFSWAKWSGYACDMGGRQLGCVLRYKLDENGGVLEVKDITPPVRAGFGGISTTADGKGLICSTQGSERGDEIFYSADNGNTWTTIMRGLEVGKMDFSSVPYMSPKYNGGGNLVHWMSDIKIDPFNSSRAVFNTGTGIFMTENLEAAESGGVVAWSPVCAGVEETVHLNVYSPPKGDVHLIDIVGDLGGFAFADLTKQRENSFADENGNRYITCLNADFTEENPLHAVVTARGNWTGRTTGGLIWSEDQCETWRRLPDPIGLTPRIDGLIEKIRTPNTNSGWAAISADERTLIWCVGEGDRLPAEAVVYTTDLGESWHKVEIFGADKAVTLKVLSDRIDPAVFYGFGDGSLFYISTDAGRNFYQLDVPLSFPKMELGGIDGRMPAEIRAQSDMTGVVWISTGENGLWRVKYDKNSKAAIFEKITREGEAVYRQGMGAPTNGHTCPTLYVNGTIGGEYGFYRSPDYGKNWYRINTNKQMYGDIRSIVGDPRVAGRFYIASGSRGVLWGEEL